MGGEAPGVPSHPTRHFIVWHNAAAGLIAIESDDPANLRYVGVLAIGCVRVDRTRPRSQRSRMCLAVYVGSTSPLPLVHWTEVAPAFNARTLAPHEQPVREKLAFAHLALLGAHTGCGCGFIMDGADEPADVRRSREALARYVADALGHGPTELYVCWNGDEAQPSERRLALAPNELPPRDDWLAERTHVTLRAPTG